MEPTAPTEGAPEDQRIRRLLEGGGMVVSRGPSGEVDHIGAYNGLRNPEGAEELGDLLADRLRPHEPAGVVIWQEPQAILLAYVVSRRLGVSAVRTYDADGLVAFDGSFPPGDRIILVADVFRTAETVRAMAALVEQQGKTVVAAGSLSSLPGAASDELTAMEIIHVSLEGPLELTGGDRHV